jgi:hypothetical protein
MASIGSATFATLSLDGAGAASTAQAVETTHRTGINGNDFRLAGKVSGPARYISTTDFSSGSNLKSAKVQYDGLVGTQVTLTDMLGNTFVVVVLGVDSVEEQKTAITSGGIASGNYILRARWEVQVI